MNDQGMKTIKDKVLDEFGNLPYTEFELKLIDLTEKLTRGEIIILIEKEIEELKKIKESNEDYYWHENLHIKIEALQDLFKEISSLTEKEDVNESGFALGGEQSEKNTETSLSEMGDDLKSSPSLSGVLSQGKEKDAKR